MSRLLAVALLLLPATGCTNANAQLKNWTPAAVVDSCAVTLDRQPVVKTPAPIIPSPEEVIEKIRTAIPLSPRPRIDKSQTLTPSKPAVKPAEKPKEVPGPETLPKPKPKQQAAAPSSPAPVRERRVESQATPKPVTTPPIVRETVTYTEPVRYYSVPTYYYRTPTRYPSGSYYSSYCLTPS